MLFHAPTQKFVFDIQDIQSASRSLRYAIFKIRLASKLPLGPYDRPGPMSEADHAQRAIIDAAVSLGIDLGGRWGNELDVQDLKNA